MILLASLVVGLLFGWLAGGSIRGLAAVRLRGESTLLALVFATALMPRVFESVSPRWHEPLLAVWAVGMLMLIWLSWLNRESPGIGGLGVGLALNLVVILANGGMPVSLGLVAGGWTADALDRLRTSTFHTLADEGTVLGFLGDVMYVPGARVLVSAGDVVMLVGVVVFVSWAMLRETRRKPATAA